MHIDLLLNPLEQMELEFVRAGFKPAFMKAITPHGKKEFRKIQLETFNDTDEIFVHKVDKGFLRDYDATLLGFGPTQLEIRKSFLTRRSLTTWYNFAVSNDERLRSLLTTQLDPFVLGRALEYPQSAIDRYRKDNRAASFQRDLQRGQDAGFEVPSWFAYISFLPARFDLSKPETYKDAMQAGTRNQDIAKHICPGLMPKVEDYFKKTHLSTCAYAGISR